MRPVISHFTIWGILYSDFYYHRVVLPLFQLYITESYSMHFLGLGSFINIMYLRSIHVMDTMLWKLSVVSSSLLLSGLPLYTFNLLIQSPVDRHLGCFQVWTIMNKTAISILVQIFLHCLVIDIRFYFSWVNI